MKIRSAKKLLILPPWLGRADTGGGTLIMVYERVLPFYKDTVLPLLLGGKNVMIVAHGNSLRALIHASDSVSDSDMSHWKCHSAGLWSMM